MSKQSRLLNLFGQIRIYSLVDLVIFSLALGAGLFQVVGIILLHLGFLLFLEYTHKHEFRVAFPRYLWVVLFVAGIIFYQSIAVIGFLVCSFLYVKKNLPKFGPYAPFLRGGQYYFLASGMVGFLNPLAFLAFVLATVRNFAGDLRDVVKDGKDGLKTLPVIFGLKRDFKYVHLLTLFCTSAIWIYLSGLPMSWLVFVFAIQIGSYNLTPR